MTFLGEMFGSKPKMTNPYDAAEPQFMAAQGLQQQNIGLNQQYTNEGAAAILADTAEQAKQIMFEGMQIVGQHAIDYGKSGVMISDTPLKVLQTERKMIKEDVAATEKRGMAQANLLRLQGQIKTNESYASLIGSNMQFQVQKQNAANAAAASGGGGFSSILGGLQSVFSAGKGLVGMFTGNPLMAASGAAGALGGSLGSTDALDALGGLSIG